MELTKDELFRIRYNETTNRLEMGKEKNKIAVWVKKNKMFTTIIGITILFIATDVILLQQFLNLIKVL